jgi:hypothetical protein
LKRHSVGREDIWWEHNTAWAPPTMYFLSQKPELSKYEKDYFLAAKDYVEENYASCYRRMNEELQHAPVLREKSILDEVRQGTQKQQALETALKPRAKEKGRGKEKGRER